MCIPIFAILIIFHPSIRYLFDPFPFHHLHFSPFKSSHLPPSTSAASSSWSVDSSTADTTVASSSPSRPYPRAPCPPIHSPHSGKSDPEHEQTSSSLRSAVSSFQKTLGGCLGIYWRRK